jgi:hypothetical protein
MGEQWNFSGIGALFLLLIVIVGWFFTIGGIIFNAIVKQPLQYSAIIPVTFILTYCDYRLWRHVIDGEGGRSRSHEPPGKYDDFGTAYTLSSYDLQRKYGCKFGMSGLSCEGIEKVRDNDWHIVEICKYRRYGDPSIFDNACPKAHKRRYQS